MIKILFFALFYMCYVFVHVANATNIPNTKYIQISPFWQSQ